MVSIKDRIFEGCPRINGHTDLIIELEENLECYIRNSFCTTYGISWTPTNRITRRPVYWREDFTLSTLGIWTSAFLNGRCFMREKFCFRRKEK